MAKFQFDGVDELISMYEKLEKDSMPMIGEAVYTGANVVMRYVEQGIDSIITDDRHGTPENPTNGPTTYQKEGLHRSVGIAKARFDGNFYNVKIGFSGYNQLSTKRWPQGQPNSLIARAVQSGTSWMRKQPFMRQAEQSAKKPCEDAMAKVVDKAIEKIAK